MKYKNSRDEFWCEMIEGLEKERKTKLVWVVIKCIVLVLLVLWVYGVFYYKPVEKVEVYDECSRTSSVNNCFVISR